MVKYSLIQYTTVCLQIYYWISFLMSYAVSFVLLLAMNSVIIQTLRQRSTFVRSDGQGQGTKLKNPDKQIYIMLLLVTFSFFKILTTPVYVSLLFVTFYQRFAPYYIAINHLFSQVGVKTLFTNNGINFYLYVMSGQKFRTDLKKLFSFKKIQGNDSSIPSLSNTNSTTISTIAT